MIKTIRTIHRWLGFLFSIFFISTAITGFILVFRKNIPNDIEDFLYNLHTYEIFGIFKYIALLVALVLVGLSISGIILFINVEFKKSNKKGN